MPWHVVTVSLDLLSTSFQAQLWCAHHFHQGGRSAGSHFMVLPSRGGILAHSSVVGGRQWHLCLQRENSEYQTSPRWAAV